MRHILVFTSLTLLLGIAQATETRLVTIGGAATEIVFALGKGNHVVARDQSSLYPADKVGDIPEIGYVRAIDAEPVLAQRPDLIIATSDLGPPIATQQLKSAGVPLVVVPAPNSPESLAQAIAHIAEKLDAEEAGAELNAQLSAQLAEIRAFKKKPRVALFLVHQGAGVTIGAGRGTKADAMIRLAGGENILATHNGYKAVDSEALIALNPDVILLAVQEGTGQETRVIEQVQKQPGWQAIRAVSGNHVHPVPMGRTLNFGPRMGESALVLNGLFARALKN